VNEYEFHKTVFVVVLLVLALVLTSLLTGCASPDAYRHYLSAQSAAIKAQKPMLEIVAQDGQAITGLKSIRVYGNSMSIQQERPSEWAQVATSGLQVLGVVGGIVAAGQASQDLVSAVGGLGVSSSIVTTTTDNRTSDRHDIANSYNATAAPTVVTQPAPLVVTQPAPIVVTP
jgi:type IV pilus biogenesis protein CpaD/CtpE